VDVSLGALRQRLLNFRSWDSTGETLDNRIREVLNVALDRLAGDVPEALIPDEAHVALIEDVKSGNSDVNAYVKSWNVTRYKSDLTSYTDDDARLLMFLDVDGNHIESSSSKTTWRPVDTGEWDYTMHIEVTDANTGRVYRRQCLEWFYDTVIQSGGGGDTGNDPIKTVYWGVTLDRPLSSLTPITQSNTIKGHSFRIHQPEFFLRDDVMEVLEPARIYDSSRQQVWAIDTAGAYRQDMIDFQGNSGGRPYRMWRGRHVQIPAPTEAPEITQLNLDHSILSSFGDSALYKSDLFWGYKKPESALAPGRWGLCYTYVVGRRDKEWQQSPAISSRSGSVSRGGATAELDSRAKVTWAHGNKPFSTDPEVAAAGSTHLASELNTEFGTFDPLLESAPSPITEFRQSKIAGMTLFEGGIPEDADFSHLPAMVFGATNIDAMLGFDEQTGLRGAGVMPFLSDVGFQAVRGRFGRTGYRIRYYLAYLGKLSPAHPDGDFNSMEVTPRYYYLCEAEPTYDMINDNTGLDGNIYSAYEPPAPSRASRDSYSSMTKKGGRVVWHGTELPDYNRPLRHSTGYYAYSCYPHQDSRYELDFRVLRLPRKYVDDQDTAPIQRDAVPALIELALHYLCLVDGADQNGAEIHLRRYEELARKYRERYANPGRVVEPTPLLGYARRRRLGTFSNET